MRGLLAATAFITCLTVIGCAGTYKPANPSAFGKTWEFIGVTPDHLQSFHDHEKLSYSGRIITTDWRGVDKSGNEYLFQAEVDCARNQMRLLNGSQYDSNLRYVGQIPDSAWLPLPAGSVGITFAQGHCR